MRTPRNHYPPLARIYRTQGGVNIPFVNQQFTTLQIGLQGPEEDYPPGTYYGARRLKNLLKSEYPPIVTILDLIAETLNYL